MRSIRRPAALAVAAVALVAFTGTACGPEDDNGDPNAAATADDQIKLPSGFPTSLPSDLPSGLPTTAEELEKWKKGGWKDWENWAREAAHFINPIIEDLWDQERAEGAEGNDKPVEEDIAADQGATDPDPEPVRAAKVATPYTRTAPAAGKLFFDTPEGQGVCSATVVEDPAHPGKSNLVWTAGHCVHTGSKGGWLRNLMFAPAYNNGALPRGSTATEEQIFPHGQWWVEDAKTSDEWIAQGTETGANGAPYDFAVLKVKNPAGNGKSLEETVGAALPIWFDAPFGSEIGQIGNWGYPAAPPYDGVLMFGCEDTPGRLSLFQGQPTMHRIGCTMTGGSSGGGWYATGPDGKPALVSNTSIGPTENTWLAGPRLGEEAEALYKKMSKEHAGD
ncbi:trypsin-like serine peptidase [Streptomyces sp. NPDC059506]|uniref:trypsin-like serine peptidase n=1 Tax=Streptomyces TaxID=1883 RepID=UPI000CA955C4|nr:MULTISPECIES: hypothetical protein [unclassified Streptomyces]MCZ2527278.1 hypothetical protein [Streptomyces sp. HB2AG]PLW74552.1 hypothetical protein C0036_01315 [Streptomyces sp. DJ]QMV21462.1 hypothetical protein GQS52_06380 [Streptomyces sp. SCUT-3]